MESGLRTESCMLETPSAYFSATLANFFLLGPLPRLPLTLLLFGLTLFSIAYRPNRCTY